MNQSEPNPPDTKAAATLPEASLLQVPGIFAVSLYLVLLALVIVIGVISGNHYPPFYLLFSVLLLSASGGLVLLFRWAWALGLATVFLLASYDLYIFTMQHELTVLLQGVLNLIFFLYLVRPEVRDKLR